MSDPKHRSPPPRAHGSTPPSSSASQRHAVPNSHASSKGNDASQRLKKPQQVDEKQSGRVAFDAKGNPVWEWQTSTGVFEQNVSTQRLKKLEAPELSLAATQPIPTLGGNSKGNTSNKAASNFAGKSPTTTKSKEDTGFNPYDSDAPVRPRTDRTAASHPALVHKRPPNGKGRDAVSKPQGTWDKFKSKFS
ncbi:MAG TPA: hypothetical protein VHL14_05275 [Steroidobacteraceae bacterium]|nr:hypothetical protein [Steroidobacteraceae bacterium]